MSIATFIKHDLIANIRSGTIKADRLTLDALSKRYQVSTRPVRAAVQELIEETGLVSEPFPLHAPELNPVDRVWGYVKYNRIPNFAPPDLGILRSTLTREFDRVGSMPDLLKSLIGSTGRARSPVR